MFFLKNTCSISHYILYSLYLSFYNSEFRKKKLKMVIGFPHFCKLDSNDEWVDSCGSTKCSQNHNIRKNASLLSWSCHDMNWLDFLDILDCYRCQHIAECRFCKRCGECHQFKLLCAEAWGITLSSWRNMGSYVVAVRFNSMNRNYRRLPLTCDILNKQFINNDEIKLYKEKEQKIFYEKIINKYRNW